MSGAASAFAEAARRRTVKRVRLTGRADRLVSNTVMQEPAARGSFGVAQRAVGSCTTGWNTTPRQSLQRTTDARRPRFLPSNASTLLTSRV
jgi:hypothetical protein